MRRVIRVALLGVLAVPTQQLSAQAETSALRPGARVRLWRHGPTSGFFQGRIVERAADTLTVSDRRTNETHIRVAIPDLDSAYVGVHAANGFGRGFARGALIGLGVTTLTLGTIALTHRSDGDSFVPVHVIVAIWSTAGMVVGGIIGGTLGAHRITWVPVALSR